MQLKQDETRRKKQTKTNISLYFAQCMINKCEGRLKMYFPSFLVQDDRPRVTARRYCHGDASPALHCFLLILVSETRIWISWGLFSRRGLWSAPQRALQGSQVAIRCCYFHTFLLFLLLHVSRVLHDTQRDVLTAGVIMIFRRILFSFFP